MKTPSALLALFLPTLAALTLTGCNRSATADDHAGHEPAVENGAQFKAGEGLSLTAQMRRALDLQVAEVAEQPVAPTFTTLLHVLPVVAAANPPAAGGGFQRVAFSPSGPEAAPAATEANGWLSATQAALVKPGMEVELHAEGLEAAPAAVARGVVRRVEKMPYAGAPGDFEVGIAPETPLPVGARVRATFRGAAGEPVASVPRSALLQTAEGSFVYAVNAQRFLRTPVKVGAMDATRVEITDGLYAGDEVVASPVQALWMAELQVLRGGKACTCGH